MVRNERVSPVGAIPGDDHRMIYNSVALPIRKDDVSQIHVKRVGGVMPPATVRDEICQGLRLSPGASLPIFGVRISVIKIVPPPVPIFVLLAAVLK